jgi:sigma-B regulation protein RsbU (phosphoserine phosphatase)
MELSSRILEQSCSAKAEKLHEIRLAVRNCLFGLGLSSTQVDPLILAVSEACTNIIEHGYGPENSGEMTLEIFHNQNEIIFRLTDFAKPIDHSKIVPRDLDEIRPGGLGIHFMQTLMDVIEFQKVANHDGNILIMKKHIE